MNPEERIQKKREEFDSNARSHSTLEKGRSVAKERTLDSQKRGRERVAKIHGRAEYYKATITLHRGMDLLAKDETGTSDPYCKIVPVSRSGMKVKRSAVKSKIISETCSPSWEESLTLVLDASQTSSVEVSCFDAPRPTDSPTRQNDHSSLGSFQLPIKALIDGSKGSKIYKLDGVERGRMIISFSARTCDENGKPTYGGYKSLVKMVAGENKDKINGVRARSASPRKAPLPKRAVSSSPTRVDIRKRLGKSSLSSSPFAPKARPSIVGGLARPGSPVSVRTFKRSDGRKKTALASPHERKFNYVSERPKSMKARPSFGVGAPGNKMTGSLTNPYKGSLPKGLSPDVKRKMYRREEKIRPGAGPKKSPMLRLNRTGRWACSIKRAKRGELSSLRHCENVVACIFKRLILCILCYSSLHSS